LLTKKRQRFIKSKASNLREGMGVTPIPLDYWLLYQQTGNAPNQTYLPEAEMTTGPS
jgi:hypothetical protein